MDLKEQFENLDDIRNLTKEYTQNNSKDRFYSWEILLNYLQNEDVTFNNQSGFRNKDLLTNSIWKELDSKVDLSPDFFNTILNDITYINNIAYLYVQSLGVLNDAELAEKILKDYYGENGLKTLFWNESMTKLLSMFSQKMDSEQIKKYENYGELVELDDTNGIINDTYLRGGIAVKDGYSFRVNDIKKADAGANFVRESQVYTDLEQYVIYDFSQTTYDFEENKYDGKINGTYVLKNGTKEKTFDYEISVSLDFLQKINGNYTIIVNNNNVFLSNYLKEKYYDKNGNRLSEYNIIESDKKILKGVINPWVIPWYNLNGHSYRYVRSNDIIKGVLSDSNKLDFTVSQKKNVNQWIRLIMPQHKRRVEVEDLNRNFWVIGQVTSAISSYLFDEESPFTTILGGLLNEIMQLWENIFYLWAALAASSSTKYTKIHKEVIYLYNNKEQNYLKYDNFDFNQNLTNAQIKDIVSPYLDKYKDSNICLIIAQRDNNYEHNYFSKEIYLGVFTLDRNKEREGEEGNFGLGCNWISFNNGSYPYFDLKEEDSQKLCSLRQTNSEYYTVGALSNVNNYTEIFPHNYYSLIEPIYTIDISENDLSSLSFIVKYYDIAAKIFSESHSERLYRTLIINIENNEVKEITFPAGNSYINNTNKSIDIENGFYQGELLSIAQQEQKLLLNVQANSIISIPRNYDPINNEIIDELDVEQTKTKYRIDDINLLNIKSKEDEYNNKISLITITHASLGAATDSPGGQVGYWYADNNTAKQKILDGSSNEWGEKNGQFIHFDDYWGGTSIATLAKLYFRLNNKEIFDEIYNDYPYSLSLYDMVYKRGNSYYPIYGALEYNKVGGLRYSTCGYASYYIYTRKGQSIDKTNWVIEEVDYMGYFILTDTEPGENENTYQEPTETILTENPLKERLALSKSDMENYLEPAYFYDSANGSSGYPNTCRRRKAPCASTVQTTLFYPNQRMERKIQMRDMTKDNNIIINSNFKIVSKTPNYPEIEMENNEDYLMLDGVRPTRNIYPINGQTR